MSLLGFNQLMAWDTARTLLTQAHIYHAVVRLHMHPYKLSRYNSFLSIEHIARDTSRFGLKQTTVHKNTMSNCATVWNDDIRDAMRLLVMSPIRAIARFYNNISFDRKLTPLSGLGPTNQRDHLSWVQQSSSLHASTLSQTTPLGSPQAAVPKRARCQNSNTAGNCPPAPNRASLQNTLDAFGLAEESRTALRRRTSCRHSTSTSWKAYPSLAICSMMMLVEKSGARYTHLLCVSSQAVCIVFIIARFLVHVSTRSMCGRMYADTLRVCSLSMQSSSWVDS